MTDLVLIALIAIVPTTLTAIGGVVLTLMTLRNGWKTDAVGQVTLRAAAHAAAAAHTAELTADKTREIAYIQQDIHKAVNGNLKALNDELTKARAEIVQLRIELAQARQSL